MASQTGKGSQRRGRSTKSLGAATASMDPSKQGTVLLRNPLPKYSFMVKSKSSKESKTENTATENVNKAEVVIENKDNLTVSDNIKSEQKNGNNVNQQVGNVNSTFLQTDETGRADTEDSIMKEKPVNKVDPFSQKKLTQSASESSLIRSQTFDQSFAPQTLNQSANITESSGTGASASIIQKQGNSQGTPGTSEVTVEGEENQSFGSPCCGCKDKVRHLEEEKQMLKNQLEVQLQVNLELKKLLVASVGDDLHHRVERLTRDKALLSQEVGDYTKKMCEGYEHMDKISIQADMWRSKYLACRVMADELAQSKAFFSLQFEEAQRALQQLLNERHQLRAHLYDTYRGLQQIQEAFDPLKTLPQTGNLLNSKNVLDLARTNQHLTDAVKYRLLPSHVTSIMNSKMETDWTDYLTIAETHAQDLLTREVRAEDFRYLGQQAIAASPGAVDRFHPCARYDNLTLNVCCKCKGDISIV